MRNFVAFYCVGNRLRLHIVEPHKGAREEREPDIHRDQSEDVVKRQKGQQLQLALVVLFNLRALPDNAVAALNLAVELPGGVGADFDVRRGARGHDHNRSAEFIFAGTGRALRKLIGKDGFRGEAFAVGHNGGCIRNPQRVF